ncbi:MAG: glycerol kinase GlpK [Actinomycetota bacterium]
MGVLDLGTTSVRFIIFKLDGSIHSQAFQPVKQFYPQPGWVEEDLDDIWSATRLVIEGAIDKGNIEAREILAIGITNQRESVALWDAETGKPLGKLIVWQDRRTSRKCQELHERGYEELVKEKTGLTIDPYFSATKIEWMLEKDSNLKNMAARGKVCFGTVDSFIIYKLNGSHITDYSNASRTLLFNISSLQWDSQLLELFGVPEKILPQLAPSYSPDLYGKTKKDSPFGTEIPIASVFGDQQAALFGHHCFQKGDVKSTFGTGSFIMMNSGKDKIISRNGLLSTIFYGDGRDVFYALEGSVYNTGSIFQWLKEGMGIIADYKDIEFLASRQDYQKDLFMVPALTGMGAPYWDPYARGMLIGITRSTSKGQIVRAAVEAIAYRTLDVLNVMEKDTDLYIETLKIDGGVSQNKLFCQILADIIGKKILKLDLQEITALGAMFGAGLAIGLWDSKDKIKERTGYEGYMPDMDAGTRNQLYSRWQKAVAKARNWAEE